jgi:hypothetical protein
MVRAVALERSLIAGTAAKNASSQSLAEDVANHLRSLLRDVICGHLDPDLAVIADELLEPDELLHADEDRDAELEQPVPDAQEPEPEPEPVAPEPALAVSTPVQAPQPGLRARRVRESPLKARVVEPWQEQEEDDFIGARELAAELDSAESPANEPRAADEQSLAAPDAVDEGARPPAGATHADAELPIDGVVSTFS